MMESYAQIALNLLGAGVRSDWCVKIAAADDLLEYAKECADERDERPACIKAAA